MHRVIAAAERKSSTKSRSETASILFSVMRAKPNSRATIGGRCGSVVPAKAPAPSGITSVRAARLLETLAIAAEHLDIGEQMMGERDRLRALQMRIAGHDVATWRRRADEHCAKPGDQRDHARRFRRADRGASPARPDRCASARYAACGRRSPIFAVSRRSTARWISSSARSNLKRPSAISVSIARVRRRLLATRARFSSPIRSSIRACAIDPRISCRKSRRSKGSDAVKASTSGSGRALETSADEIFALAAPVAGRQSFGARGAFLAATFTVSAVSSGAKRTESRPPNGAPERA